MFRLLRGNRCQALLARRAGIIFRPRFLHSDDDEIRTMAEQLVYMQDLLKGFLPGAAHGVMPGFCCLTPNPW